MLLFSACKLVEQLEHPTSTFERDRLYDKVTVGFTQVASGLLFVAIIKSGVVMIGPV